MIHGLDHCDQFFNYVFALLIYLIAMIRTIPIKIDSGSFVMERFVVKRTPKVIVLTIDLLKDVKKGFLD
mgnify:CR=1 FL=1